MGADPKGTQDNCPSGLVGSESWRSQFLQPHRGYLDPCTKFQGLEDPQL